VRVRACACLCPAGTGQNIPPTDHTKQPLYAAPTGAPPSPETETRREEDAARRGTGETEQKRRQTHKPRTLRDILARLTALSVKVCSMYVAACLASGLVLSAAPHARRVETDPSAGERRSSTGPERARAGEPRNPDS